MAQATLDVDATPIETQKRDAERGTFADLAGMNRRGFMGNVER